MDGDPNNFDNAVAFVRKVCAPFLRVELCVCSRSACRS